MTPTPALVPCTTYWARYPQGRKSENCTLDGLQLHNGTWIHWIYPKGCCTNATLSLSGLGSYTAYPGPPKKAKVFHFYTPYYNMTGLHASVTGCCSGGNLVISDFCSSSSTGEGTTPTLAPTPTLATHLTPEATPEPTPKPTPKPMPEPTPEPAPKPTPKLTPEPTPEPTPELTPELMPKQTNEPTPEPTNKLTPKPTPEPMPQPMLELTPKLTPRMNHDVMDRMNHWTND